MSSPIVRGALIGGAVSLIGWLLVRALLRNLHWIALAVLLLLVLDRCAPDYREVSRKRALRDSFDRTKVTASDVRGETPADPHWRYVEAVSAVVRNEGAARIYDLRLNCEFSTVARTGSDGVVELEHSRVTSSYHYGYIKPGDSAAVRPEVNGNGYLSRADPASFRCTPLFQVEAADLFKGVL